MFLVKNLLHRPCACLHACVCVCGKRRAAVNNGKGLTPVVYCVIRPCWGGWRERMKKRGVVKKDGLVPIVRQSRTMSATPASLGLFATRGGVFSSLSVLAATSHRVTLVAKDPPPTPFPKKWVVLRCGVYIYTYRIQLTSRGDRAAAEFVANFSTLLKSAAQQQQHPKISPSTQAVKRSLAFPNNFCGLYNICWRDEKPFLWINIAVG